VPVFNKKFQLPQRETSAHVPADNALVLITYSSNIAINDISLKLVSWGYTFVADNHFDVIHHHRHHHHGKLDKG